MGSFFKILQQQKKLNYKQTKINKLIIFNKTQDTPKQFSENIVFCGSVPYIRVESADKCYFYVYFFHIN